LTQVRLQRSLQSGVAGNPHIAGGSLKLGSASRGSHASLTRAYSSQ